MEPNVSGNAAGLSRYEQKRKKKSLRNHTEQAQNFVNDKQSQTSMTEELQDSTSRPARYTETDIYAETAVWLCTNLKTGYKTRIHGSLAQILKKYPEDYKLSLLSI